MNEKDLDFTSSDGPLRVGPELIRRVVSRYTIVIPSPTEPHHALYNTATGNYLVLTDELRRAYLEVARGEPLEGSEETLLDEHGFFVPGDVDEVSAIRYAFEAGRVGDHSPMLTIAPTMNCNFGCSYCFESHRQAVMKPPVQAACLDFVRQILSRLGGPRGLNVTWFGGEPTLAFGVVTAMTEQFLALEAEGQVSQYTAKIVTNGYALTAEMAARFPAMHIRHAQITLDGPSRIHNARRTLKAAMVPTMARILENIRHIPRETAVTVRMNVDRNNAAYAGELFEELDAAGLLGRVSVQLAQVEDMHDGAKVNMAAMDNVEFAEFLEAARAQARDRGWPLSSGLPQPSVMGVCQVDSQNGFVVDPEGTLYRCWAELGNQGEPVGHLLNKSSWGSLIAGRYRDRDPFDDEDCQSCRLLPTCMGACPKLRDINRRFRHKECPPYKHTFEKLVYETFGSNNRVRR